MPAGHRYDSQGRSLDRSIAGSLDPWIASDTHADDHTDTHSIRAGKYTFAHGLKQLKQSRKNGKSRCSPYALTFEQTFFVHEGATRYDTKCDFAG